MKHRPSWLLIVLILIFLGLIWNMTHLAGLFHWFFPDLTSVVYERASFAELVGEHLFLVAISSGLASVMGVLCGIFVTRSIGRDFLPVVNSLASLGQTFPPVAVLALAVPVVGFGSKPTIVALFLYGLLPIIRNTITGLETVSPSLLEAGKGMGMTTFQVLWKLELPLALGVIVAGIRTSTIINIGTATLGATIGAGGLGAPIIAGLIGENHAYVLQGTLFVGLFAVITDLSLETVEQQFKTQKTVLGD